MANVLPYLFNKYGVDEAYRHRVDAARAAGEASPNLIPPSVVYSFKIGAVAFLLAVLWTVITSKEYPPENMEEFERKKREHRGIRAGFAEIASAIREMPQTMKQLAVVQIFTWLGLFCMWMFFGLATSYHIFGAKNADDPLFVQGQAWGGISFAVYSIVCFAVAFVLPRIAKATSRKTVHAISLTCGSLGLLSVYFIHDQYVLLITMVGVGIAWASILSMPYAILAGALPPARMGVYMGVFNFFIVIPEIVASLTFQPLVKYVFNNNPLYVVMLGGASLLVAAALVVRVRDVADRDATAGAVINADEIEPFTVQESAQPVPSTGLIDEK